MDILLVSGGSGDEFEVTLRRNHDNATIDLTGAVVTMKVRAVGSSTTLYTMTAAGSTEQRESGKVVFKFTSEQKDLSSGKYEGQIQASFPSGDAEKLYDKVEIFIAESF
jgi:hypothetical protein